MQMGPRERALYLRRLAAAKQAQEAGVKEEEDATLAGNNIAALRSWFRQVLSSSQERRPLFLKPEYYGMSASAILRSTHAIAVAQTPHLLAEIRSHSP